MRLFTYSVALLLLAISVAACNAIDSNLKSHAQKAASPSPTSQTPSDAARRITIDELEALIKDKSVFVLDVRSQDSYDAGHIPGSRLIPAGEVQNHLKELPRDKMIVTYCS